jgi:Na+/H+ antiporter NhaD/arsenite permease-like protein
MNIAVISLASLIIAILLGGYSRLNVGILALSFAWLIGSYLAGMPIATIVSGFPIHLALVLIGITMLFGEAQQNGTLANLTNRVIGVAGNHRALLPPLFFLLALALSTLGPGNIAAVALIAPVALAIAGRSGISAFLMTLMVANGANAGAFSPFAPTGIIANGLIAKQGLLMDPWSQVYLPSLVAQSAIAAVGYFLFGGIQLWQEDYRAQAPIALESYAASNPLNRAQRFTLAAVAALILGVVLFKADSGFLALTLAAMLAFVGAANHEEAIRTVPWDTILLVCGVSTLIAILMPTGGLDLFTTLLARIATPSNVPGVIAFIAGALSAYSSSSGVVMPAFIATVPGLIAKMGGGDPVAIISAINVGSHVVDVSPLSTLGALCIANAAAHEDRQQLFRALLIYGLSMAVVGAVVCYIFFGVL